MAKKFDPKAKAKRQKIIAAVGGVLLLGLLAFQVPRTLKMLHQQGADSAASSTTSSSSGTTTGPIAPPTLGGANAAAPASASSDGLIDPDAVPPPQSGQLLLFGRFRTKDPFSQQIADCSGGDSAGAACATPAATPPTTTAPSPGKGGAAPSPSPGSSPAPAAPARPTSAKIAVNGLSETVAVGAQFPASSPTFTLVSLTATSARIAIVGGAFESGTKTVTLKKNKPLTLMNTADGTRYVLRLLTTA